MSERSRFVIDRLRTEWSMTELCERYGISRKTGYKWLSRFLEEGQPGLLDRSRAPRSCPHKTSDHLVELLIQARKHHPHWGPGKLLAILGRKHPHQPWPAESTAADILNRHGLVLSTSVFIVPRTSG